MAKSIINYKILNKTYCPMPFVHIYNDSAGWYDLCCHTGNYTRTHNVDTTLPFDFLFSKEMNEVRNKMLNGEKVDVCQRCYEQEQFTGDSKRIEYIDTYGTPSKIGKVYIKLRIFGNYCNLSCYMCHPHNSSTRAKELNDLNEINSHWRFDDPVHFKKLNYEQVEKNILVNIESKRMYEFLEKIPQDYSNSITLHFSTNFTKTEWKGHSVDDILEKFDKVLLSVSCDHFSDKLAWIRHPINVDEFENNLLSYRRKVKIYPTVSVLNVEELDEITKYYKDNFNIATEFDSASIVNSPSILTPSNHINRESIISKYIHRNDLKHVISYMTDKKYLKSRDKLRIKMFDYLDKLSLTRGDWKKLWKTI